MIGLALQQPELVGREMELNKLKQALDNTIGGKGSTIFISGEAGIGKTRLVSELVTEAESKGIDVIQGWCLAESLEPLMPIKSALREGGLFHLIAGEPPPLAVSAYLMGKSGLLIAKAEREETDLDSDVFAGMLSAVSNFIKDSLSMMDRDEVGGLNSIGYGKYTILLQSLGKLSLGTVIEGTNSEFLIDDMKLTLAEIGDRFDSWSGEISEVKDIEPRIKWFIDSGKYDGKFFVDDPKIKQENLFDNVLLGIHRASIEKPILLFLDDLQWSDPTTLNLVHYLSRNTRDNKVLILGTYRPEDIVESHDGKRHQLETTMQGMNREDLLDKIELKRLGPKDTEKIITSALGKVAFDNKFYEKIYHETEGTPFFVLEVIKLFVEEECIEPDDEGIRRLVADPDKLDIPSKVYDIVKRRLDRLMKEQRKILDCASVIGEEFQSNIIEKAMELNKLQLLENLSEIEKTHKLIHYLKDKYRFDHAKIKEVLYNDIGEELRKEYHRIIADTIAELHKDDMDEVVSDLSYHYYTAGDEKAEGYLIRAGDRAKERYANEEAVRFYESAFEFVEKDKRVLLRENLGDIWTLMGEYDKAVENYERGGEVAKEDETKARMLRKIGDVYEKISEYKKSLNVLSKARKLIKEGKNTEYGRIRVGEGYAYERMGYYDKAMPLFLEAMKIFEEFESEDKDIGNALRAVGNIYWDKGEYDNALQYYKKSLAMSENIGYHYGIAAALNNMGLIYDDIGKPKEALEYYERSLKILKKIGDKQGIASSLGNIGVVCRNKGDPDKALDYYEQSLEIGKKIGDKRGIAQSLNNIGVVYDTKGDLDKAMESYEQSFEIAKNIGDKWGIALSLGNIGSVHAARDEMEKAVEYYEKSLDIYLEIGERRLSIYNYCGLAEANLQLGDVQTALEQAKKAFEISAEIGVKTEEGIVCRTLGIVYREGGRWNDAVEEFEKAEKILKETDEKEELSRVYYEFALLWKAEEEQTKARECMEMALEMFEEMGMKLWVEKAVKALEEIKQ